MVKPSVRSRSTDGQSHNPPTQWLELAEPVPQLVDWDADDRHLHVRRFASSLGTTSMPAPAQRGRGSCVEMGTRMGNVLLIPTIRSPACRV